MSDEPSAGTSRRSCSLAGRLDAIEHEWDVELIGTHNREALQPGATESVLSTHIQRLPRTLAVIGSVVLAHDSELVADQIRLAQAMTVEICDGPVGPWCGQPSVQNPDQPHPGLAR